MQIVDGEAAARGDQGRQGQQRHSGPRREDHPRPAADPRRGARRAARPGGRSALGARRRSGCASPTAAFVRGFGPINHTVVSVTTDPETGEERETHRRPNLAPFADDPDCWLVASIEDYDLESGLARMGPIFRERVIAPPAAPLIATAADALAVTLNETGRVDIDHLAELLDRDPETALAQLGEAVFRNPSTEAWETDDAYLSGSVRTKLALAEAAAERDPQYARNVAALRRVQPEDLRPSDITARLGAPWIPAADIEAFAAEVMGTATRVRHTVEIASWSVDIAPFIGTAAGTSEWGTSRRNAGWLLHDALNSATPQIFDTIIEDGVEKRVLNSEATEAAKEKLARIKDAFTAWIWTDPDRTDRLARLYNDRFNNLVPRRFDGRHLTLPGASSIIRLYDHQKRVIWRIVASRLDLHRPHRRRREILRHRRRHHGAEAARPDQQGHAGGARPLPGAGVARIPAALSDRPHPGRRRDQLREGEAVAVPGARGDGELGRGDHHPRGVPFHSGAGRLRARDDPGADRLLRGAHAAQR